MRFVRAPHLASAFWGTCRMELGATSVAQRAIRLLALLPFIPIWALRNTLLHCSLSAPCSMLACSIARYDKHPTGPGGSRDT